MDALLQNVKEILAAMGCKPEDEGYAQRFNDLFAEERRRADAVEERRAAAEAEERRRAAEAEERRLEREHQIRMAQQPAQPAPQNSDQQQPPPPPRISIEVLPFSPASERADRFLRRFETVLAKENVPKERYAEQLLKALPSAEATPLLEIPVEEQFDYEILKEAFLRRHRVTETQLRDDFRSARPSKEDNAGSFIRTLSRTFDYWIEATSMKKTFDQLRDRLIVDQITDLLPNHLLVILREKSAATVESVTTALDAYFDARPHQSLHQACQLANKHNNNKSNNSSRSGAPMKPTTAAGPGQTLSNTKSLPSPRPHTLFSPRTRTPPTTNSPTTLSRLGTPRSGRSAPTATTPPAGAPRQNRGTASPKGCHHHGPQASHTSEECFVLHPEKRPSVTPPTERDMNNWRQMPRLTTPPRTANVVITGPTVPQDGPAHALATLVAEETTIQPAVCAASETCPRGGLKTCEGALNHHKVTVLLDSGSDSVFVARRLIDPANFTGNTMPVRTATALHQGCPIAKVTFSCPYFPATGSAVLVIVLDDPPYDVLLGQVTGTHDFNQDPPQTPSSLPTPEDLEPSPTPNATPDEAITAVTTRGQQRAAEARVNSSTTVTGPLSPLLDIDRRQLQLLQEECDSLNKLRQRAIRHTESALHKDGVETYHLVDGLLYREELHQGCSHRQVVVPKPLRQELLKVAHENPFSGHFSTGKTESRLRREFHWPCMSEDVRNFCRSCHQCQVGNLRRTPRAPLGTPAIPTEPFAHVCVDLVGPLSPPSSEGHRYVLTLVDKATRYPDATPLRHIDSATVAQALTGMFSHVGFPTTLTSDNGTQFTSDMFEEFLKGLGTRHQLTPPYHAQSNGLVERFNGTLKQILKKLCLERPKDWHLQLPAVLFAYRDAPHAATGFSPFELVMGHRVRGPLTVVKEAMLTIPESQDTPPDAETSRSLSRRVLGMKERLQETCALARSRLCSAQAKQKLLFDRKAKARTLKVNDEVLIFLPTKPSKLLMTWQGPGTVLERLGLNTYKVQYGNRVRNYHINHLRRYVNRDAPAQSTTVDSEEGVDDPEVLPANQGAHLVHDEVTEAFAAVAIAVETPDDIDEKGRDPCVPSRTSEAQESLTFGPQLDNKQLTEMRQLTEEFGDVFSASPGLTSTLQHEIRISGTEPLRLQHSYPLPLALEPTLRQELDSWLEAGVVEPSQSPYCSPLLAVRKKDGTHRFCLDCRQLNAQTIFDSEPISDPQKIFTQISGARYFSKLDLTSGYWQVPMEEQSKPLTAFRTRFGLFQFTVMPFGLVNAPATFSRLMREVTKDLVDTHCYLDDLLVATSTWEEHLCALRQLLDALRLHGLKAKPTKCELGLNELTYLGHIVGEGQCNPLPDRVKAISEMPLPKTKKELRSFLGSVGYYSQFIPHYADLRSPLDQLLRKIEPDTLQWSPQTINSFEKLRSVLTKDPILQLPDGELPFTLQTDASDTGLGAALLQPCRKDPRKLAAVAYASRTLKGPERNYSTIEKEGLAVFWALQKFHIYLYGREFTLRTDHKPLLYLGQADRLNPRLKRWALLIGLYRFKPEHVPGAENCLPDLLSRNNQ